MARGFARTGKGRVGSLTGKNRTRPENSALFSGVSRSPCTGLGPGARVLTLDGAIPVEFLAPGDRVITRAGARILRDLTARIVRDGAIARINSGILTDDVGSDRAGQRVTVGADQGILLRDWRARAMFGRAQATVPLRALADGGHITVAPARGERLFTLIFDTDEVIYVDGLEIAVSADSTAEALAA